jgi:hypothetical protein
VTCWGQDELSRIAAEDELQLATARSDGTLRRPVILWSVRHSDELYVRAVRGRDSAWFRGARDRHQGRLCSGGLQRDVILVETDGSLDEVLDAEYRRKYRRYPASYVDAVVTPAARAATLLIAPRVPTAPTSVFG